MDSKGKIKLFTGPMYSGKTDHLIGVLKRARGTHKKYICLGYAEDNRYSDGSCISTHELQQHECIPCHKIYDVFDKIKDFDVIAIDEGQFFPDLVEACCELRDIGKQVYVSALSGDFRMEPFPVISRLISKTDDIKFLKAWCSFCGKDAGFSLRTVRSEETILIGSTSCYKAVCYDCYRKNNVVEKKTEISQENVETLKEENLCKLNEKIKETMEREDEEVEQ